MRQHSGPLQAVACTRGLCGRVLPASSPQWHCPWIALTTSPCPLVCGALYGISWQLDPCCKYQVEYDACKLSRLPLHMLTASTTAALDQENELHRKRLHNTVALAAPEYCVNKGYEFYTVTAGEWDTKNAEPRCPQDPDPYSNTGFPL